MGEVRIPSSGRKRHRSVSPSDLQRGAGKHVFDGLVISDHARAICGDVYMSCSDFMPRLTPEQEQKALVNALHYHGMHDRYVQILTATPETCDYIWKTPFATWLKHSNSQDIFWISGKPGSGKSTLMKYLVSSTSTQDYLKWDQRSPKLWTVLHFFFDFRAARTLANTKEGLYRSLLHQIISAVPFKPETLKRYKLELDHILVSNLESQTIETIVKVLQHENMKVLLLVDGLDESESNIRMLLSSIREIRERTGIRMCLASRPEPLIATMLSDCPTIKMQEYNGTGIESYISAAFHNIGPAFSRQLVASDDLIKAVSTRADGTWIWVHFAVEVLLQGLVRGFTEDEALSELEQLPNELGSMYVRIFQQIPTICRAEAALILLLLENATHTVTLSVLFRAWQHVTQKVGLCKSSMSKLSLDQFKMRLQGFLSGLLDFKKPMNLYTDPQEENPPTEFDESRYKADEDYPNSLENLNSSDMQDTQDMQDMQVDADGLLKATGRSQDENSDSTLSIRSTRNLPDATADNQDDENMPQPEIHPAALVLNELDSMEWDRSLSPAREPTPPYSTETPATKAVALTRDPAKASGDEEVRLLHETLRHFLRKDNSIRDWLGPSFWFQYPDHIWLRLYIEAIDAVESLCDTWLIVRSFFQELPDSTNGKNTNEPDSLDYEAWTEHLQSKFPVLSFPQLLFDGIGLIVSISRTDEGPDENLFQSLRKTLCCPLFLLKDLIKVRNSQFSLDFNGRSLVPLLLKRFDGTSLDGKPRWSQDLALAAASSWATYFERSSSTVSNISTLEKNYLLSCMIDGLVMFRQGLQDWQFALTEEAERIIYCLFRDGPIKSHHAAMYMVSVAYEQSPYFLTNQAIANTRKRREFQGRVITGPLEGWPFLKREGMHLLEMWARLSWLTPVALSARLDFVTQLGVDIRAYRYSDGGNIVHLVADTCQSHVDFANVIVKAQVLRDHGLNFFHLNNRGKSALWLLQAMYRDMKRINDSMQSRIEEQETGGLQIMHDDWASSTNYFTFIKYDKSMLIPEEDMKAMAQMLDELEENHQRNLLRKDARKAHQAGRLFGIFPAHWF